MTRELTLTAYAVIAVAMTVVLPWVVLFVILAVVQLAAYLQSPRPKHPIRSYVTNAALDTHVAQAAAFIAWLAAVR